MMTQAGLKGTRKGAIALGRKTKGGHVLFGFCFFKMGWVLDLKRHKKNSSVYLFPVVREHKHHARGYKQFSL